MMTSSFLSPWKRLLEQGLAEDSLLWDWSTLGLLETKATSQAKLFAKSKGTWAGDVFIQALGELSALNIRASVHDGQKFSPGQVLLTWDGPLEEILRFERPFINLVSYASGIAHQTSQFVSLVSTISPESPPRICLTRKTLPYYRDLGIYAVRVGGGYPHRVSLAGGVLLKENHIALAGSISKAIHLAKQNAPHSLKIEIEVRSIQEFEEALEAGADGILLDNFSPKEVQNTLRLFSSSRKRPFIEVSGGLNLENIQSYVLPGVSVLSIGKLTHSPESADLSLIVSQ